HAALVEVARDLLALPLLRQHVGPGVGAAIEQLELGRQLGVVLAGIGAGEATALLPVALDVLAPDDVLDQAQGIRPGAQHDLAQAFRPGLVDPALAAQALAQVHAAGHRAAVAGRGAEAEILRLHYRAIDAVARQFDRGVEPGITAADDRDLGP